MVNIFCLPVHDALLAAYYEVVSLEWHLILVRHHHALSGVIFGLGHGEEKRPSSPTRKDGRSTCSYKLDLQLLEHLLQVRYRLALQLLVLLLGDQRNDAIIELLGLTSIFGGIV